MPGRARTWPNRTLGLKCEAKNRRGTPCQCNLLLRGGRCKFHGGMSLTKDDKARITRTTGRQFAKVGPKTEAGRARSFAARDAGRERYIRERRQARAGIPDTSHAAHGAKAGDNNNRRLRRLA